MNKQKNTLDYEKLASVVADLTTDGHIQLRKKFGVISFYSKDYSEINKFNSDFEFLFKKRGNIFKDVRGNNTRYKLFISDTKLAKFLKMNGAPIGNKTNLVFFIPSWIFYGSNKIQRIYLQRLFDAEGSIFRCIDGRWRLFFNMTKKEDLIEGGIDYLNEIRILLKNFQVDTSRVRISKGNIRKDGSRSKNMKIEIKKYSFFNFYNNVNFLNPMKKTKLKRAIKEVYQ
jgi:intein/homing endonuclease